MPRTKWKQKIHEIEMKKIEKKKTMKLMAGSLRR